ncbi:Na+/H+ antiporter NhaC [Brevibacillus ruminantium]|uniref:Na+/H+ antiporter NhaC n=1 Tax=Brevibacillus ruminantium TaxID=2950604 RepID=A0ABY4WPS2_9BACL|nr:Na+/H+ antiporter NhaC [Brevibacillus ruminantium]USG66641.1 Na+/H+ antiporter NhaC [Brevibacillus ruminantium]
MEVAEGKKIPSVWVALIPILFMILSLLIGIFALELDPHIPLLASAIVATIVGLCLGYSWKDIEKGFLKTITLPLQAIVILMVIGALIGSWTAGGIVPTMIYYGLEILSPTYFLVAACAICMLVSVASGNAWTSAGTIGIAIMGMAEGFGINTALAAGAVVSGCYFGDKVSPLSEMTNLASGVTGVDLFEHIKHLMYTTVPAIGIALILYTIIGFNLTQSPGSIDQVAVLQGQLRELFVITPWILLVPLCVIIMLVFKMPAIPGLMIGSVLGTICGIVVQGIPLKQALNTLYYGHTADTGIEVIDSLLNNGGIESMFWTIALIMIAMTYGGILETTRILESLVNSILKLVKTTGHLITTTVGTSVITNILACDAYLAMIFPARMYASEYKKRGLHMKNLSRTVEDGGSVTSPLIPWNTCGAFMFATLGVHSLTYAPFAFFCFLSPIIAIIYGHFGWKIAYVDKTERARSESLGPEVKMESV